MLTAVSKRSFWRNCIGGWDFIIEDAGHQCVGEVKAGVVGWGGMVRIDGVEYRVSCSRHGFLGFSFTFKLSGRGVFLEASAPELPIISGPFAIEDGGNQKHYTLECKRGKWLLCAGQKEIGSFAWEGMWRRIRVQLPDDLPRILSLFLVWLLVRNASAGD